MNVAVVGAGIAGLRTALLLERKGIEVTVFEADSRIGGRLWTTLVGGVPFEAGAEWIDREHGRVIGLLAELGLEPVPADPRPRLHFFRGSVVDRAPVELVPTVHGSSLGDLLDASATNSLERSYLEAVALSDEGTDSDQVDLAEWRRFSENYAERTEESEGMSAFRFPISATELCERMARSIRGQIVTGMELTGVRDYFGAQLKFHGGTIETYDSAVLTLPPPGLAKLRYGGEKWWDGIEMTPTCKVALLFDEAFWERETWSMLVTDLAVQQVWPIGRVLVCYVNGRGVETLVAGGRAVERSLEALCKVLPRARAHFLEGRVVDWRRQPYAGGGFPFVPVGVRRQATPAAGPVRFAGDWTANWMGFVEGALESAERVVAEISYEHGLS